MTVTVCIVAGAADGAAGWFSVEGLAGAGAGVWAGSCWAMADGATSNPTNAVLTGTRFAMTSPQKLTHLPSSEENASYYHGRKMALRMNRSISREAALQKCDTWTAFLRKAALPDR